MRGRSLNRRHITGFTVMELVFGLLIFAILLGMTASNLKFSVAKEGPRGLAYTIASELRAARAEAQRSGKIVAVCFPSEERTNSLSRSAVVRKGEQRGHIAKIMGFGDEYDATFFIGTWPGAVVDDSHELPISWTISTADEMAIYFRPDGSAFSNEIPAIDGNYAIVSASGYSGSFNGPGGVLTGAKNPSTVWVSASGSVTVDELKLPAGSLPEGESTLAVAEFDLSNEPSPTAPTILFTKFLPEKVDGMDTASVGQNYVSVHPSQKEGGYLEYGIATIEIKAKDRDGGPLTYTLEATASAGDTGKFTVSNLEGQMRYVYDEGERDYVWHSVISWRPPPGAPPDLIYELTVLVNDPDGNSVEVSSGAGLLPRVSSLPPARLVMCTVDKELYLANLDGANEIEITKNGEEVLPFFSADGSLIFSFHDTPTGRRQLRSRTANGTSSFNQLAEFDSSGATVHFDPTFTYAALVVSDGTDYFPWLRVWTTTDSDDNVTWHQEDKVNEPPKYKILMVNLMTSDPPVQVADRVRGPDDFSWAGAENRYTFKFGTRTALAEVNGVGGSPFRGIPGPDGFEDSESSAYKLVGHPPVAEPTGNFTEEATDRSYNPADPSWYVQVIGGSLHMKNTGTSADIVLSSAGSFEDDRNNRKTPTWSANGEHVCFIESPGGSSKLVSMRVLNDAFAPVGPTVECELTGGNLSSAQLSPEGKWIYYLRGGQLFRAVNSSGSTGVNISQRISGSLNGYVISP
ncbi:MAG: hypothetical protein KC800_17860 [Candidatus Eremiobacteraeota bacterium]|nr:hypothetical protein [Candidatus Eremiobacteraeota bacterium]